MLELCGRMGAWAYSFTSLFASGIKQPSACLFGGLMVALLLATWCWYPPDAWLARLDFLALAAVAIQLALLALRMDTFEAAKVILLFHVRRHRQLHREGLAAVRFSFQPSPARRHTVVLAAAIYVNFFTHHFLPDIRWLLFAAIAWMFWPCWVHYPIRRVHRRMPLLLGFVLVAALSGWPKTSAPSPKPGSTPPSVTRGL